MGTELSPVPGHFDLEGSFCTREGSLQPGGQCPDGHDHADHYSNDGHPECEDPAPIQWLGVQTGRQTGKTSNLVEVEREHVAAGKHVHRHQQVGGAFLCLSGDPVCEAALADRNASIREDEDR